MFYTKEEFQNSFNDFANPKTHLITHDSLKKWCKKHHVSEKHVNNFIMKHDLNYDDVVEYHEFVRYYVKEEIQRKFQDYDLDRNGYATKEELLKALKDMNLSDEEINQESSHFIKLLDKNKDGKISHEEFARYYVDMNYSFK